MLKKLSLDGIFWLHTNAKDLVHLYEIPRV